MGRGFQRNGGIFGRFQRLIWNRFGRLIRSFFIEFRSLFAGFDRLLHFTELFLVLRRELLSLSDVFLPARKRLRGLNCFSVSLRRWNNGRLDVLFALLWRSFR